MSKFTLAASYQWTVKSGEPVLSEKAIKKLSDALKKRFSEGKSKHFQINYKRLRSSAGRNVLDSIYKRIYECNALIVDITEMNPNVFIELGMAISRTKSDETFSLYIIREVKSEGDLLKNLPSDLQGYFISGYYLEKNEVRFIDNNSLHMSLVSDIIDYYQKQSVDISSDEINFKV